MGLQYENASEEYSKVLENVNLFFTVVFIIEAILKIIGLSFKGYWISSWNKFDFFVVIASILDIVIDLILQGQGSFSFLRIGP